MNLFFKYHSVLCLLLLSLAVQSQNESKKWYFGNHAGLDFTTTPPTVLSNGAMNGAEGCASVADASGNLLFYTDGITVYNKAHAVMSNGTGLLGYFSSSQAAIAVKKPGSSTIYFVFTQGAAADGLCYSTIDMSLAAGMGAVTVKNTLLVSPGSEKLMSVKHCNNTDTWIVTHDPTGTTFRSYLISAGGVNATAVTSNAGTSYVSGNDIGCIKFSPNGKKMAAAIYGTGSGYEIYDFDNSTGMVSNALFLASGGFKAYGVAFSKDGSKLYGTRLLGTEIYQWDLCAGASSAIIASQYTVCGATGSDKGQVQLAPDGKIYVARYNQQDLALISNPEIAGAGCNFTEVGFSIAPGASTFGLPNFIIDATSPASIPFTYTVNGCQGVFYNAPSILQANCAASGYSLNSLEWIFGDPASGSSNTSAQVNPTHVFTSLGTYTSKLVLHYLCGGGTDTIKQQVVVNSLCLSVTKSSISCAALGSATVSASNGIGPFSYTWMPTNQSGSVATGLFPGIYTITVFDGGSHITSSSTTTLTSSSSYTGSVAHSNTPCHGIATASASVTGVSGGSGNQTYLWTDGTHNYTSATPATLGLGTWSITVTDALTACTFSQTFTVSEPPATTLQITAGAPVGCAGSSIVLTGNNSGGTGGYTYSWSSGPQTQSYAVSQPVAGIYVYTLSSADANNCHRDTTISVTFINNPVLAVNSITICPQQTGTLTVSGAISYIWNGHVTDSIFTDLPQQSVQQYTVVGSVQGCTAMATASMTVRPAPIPTLTSNSPVCEGRSLELQGSVGSSYSWVGPNGFTSTLQNPVILPVSFANSGVYTFMTSVNGCITSTSQALTVYKAPTAGFDYLPLRPVEDQDHVSFINTSTGEKINSTRWFIKDNDVLYTPVTESTMYYYRNAGTYPVALVITNELGCENTIVKAITVAADFDVYVPNAFTPNQDGRNDSFRPVVRGVTLYTFAVFDRWGEKVFSTSDVSAGWQGMYKGQPCQQGIYVWKLTAHSPYGTDKEMDGFVTLIRPE